MLALVGYSELARVGIIPGTLRATAPPLATVLFAKYSLEIWRVGGAEGWASVGSVIHDIRGN